MTKSKIRKLRQRIAKLRNQGDVSSRQLERLAHSAGRKRDPRGKEPQYISDLLPNSFPFSIPHHRKDIPVGTKLNILDSIEQDVDELEEKLIQDEVKGNGHGD